MFKSVILIHYEDIFWYFFSIYKAFVCTQSWDFRIHSYTMNNILSCQLLAKLWVLKHTKTKFTFKSLTVKAEAHDGTYSI